METLVQYFETSGRKPVQLAEDLGVEPSTITRIVKGERKPSPDLAKRISQITGVSMAALRPDLYEGFVPADGEP